MARGLFSVWLVLALLSAACQEVKQDVAAPQRPVDLVVAIDGTRSYSYVEKAKQTILKVLAQLPPGSTVTVRWITEDSYSDANMALHETLPQEPQVSGNPFDPKARRGQAIFQVILAQKRQQLAAQVMALKSPGAGATDIHGLLMRLSRHYCAMDSSAYVPKYVVMSDLEDNVNRDLRNLSFQGVEFQVLDFEEERPGQNLERFQYLVQQAGARSVKFSFTDM
jgi:hypothetical protein